MDTNFFEKDCKKIRKIVEIAFCFPKLKQRVTCALFKDERLLNLNAPLAHDGELGRVKAGLSS